MPEIKIPNDIYSRVAGYYRPVRQWNIGKKEEFRERLEYSLPENLRTEVFTQARNT